MDINIEKLIKLVKNHNTLYDTNYKDYYDRSKKKQAWEEVCSILHPTWDKSDDSEKLLYGKEVQKKWNSLRDCFRRELIVQKNPVCNGAKKKGKYKYYDALQFLTPFTTQNASIDKTDQDGGAFSAIDCESTSNYTNPLLESNDFNRKRKHSTSDEETPIAKEVYQVRFMNKRYKDDDEAFLMSLLPGFEEYTLDQKFLLRVELMQTMIRFKQSQIEQGRLVVKYGAYDDDNYTY